MEGLAEVFREEILGDGQDPWTQALGENESRHCLEEIKDRLNEKSGGAYKELFWEDGKYKRWTGYAIGYHVVKNFREKHKDFSWQRMTKEAPGSVFDEWERESLFLQ